MTYPKLQRGKGTELPLHFSALSGLFEVSSGSVIAQEKTQYHCIGHSSSGRRVYDNIHSFCPRPPLASPFYKCSFISVPDILFIFLLNILPRLCLKMKGEKNPHFSLVKSVAREIIQHHSENTKNISRHSKVSNELLGKIKTVVQM